MAGLSCFRSKPSILTGSKQRMRRIPTEYGVCMFLDHVPSLNDMGLLRQTSTNRETQQEYAVDDRMGQVGPTRPVNGVHELLVELPTLITTMFIEGYSDGPFLICSVIERATISH
ncbi:hypothetical protein TorRG33x02_285840 [Trema orientale]|uniref:Uncharacterized protein n=1 Tax=Trema orientale TaxID=63057 RepID=A0A2P5CGC4_TREOI|nr:hypothetical protein TorRG33x02_285840 [Trema orientale]